MGRFLTPCLAALALTLVAPTVVIAQGPPAMPVVTAGVELDTIEVVIESVGTVRAREATDITAEASGIVRIIHFQDGDVVSAGELLVTLDDEVQRSAREIAQVGLEGAERDLRRGERLLRDQAVAAEQVDRLRTNHLTAQAQVRAAQVQLAKRYVRAPFDGQLGLREVSPGALVQPGEVIAHISTTGALEIEFSVSETAVPRLRIGQRVYATTTVDRTTRIPARIVSIDSRIEQRTRSVRVIARTECCTDGVRPGLFVNVDLVTDRRENPAVPEEAVILEGARTYVFAVVEGTAQRREITTGQRGYGTVEVLDGLEPGDVIITEGTQKVRSGAPVVDVEVMRQMMQQQDASSRDAASQG